MSIFELDLEPYKSQTVQDLGRDLDNSFKILVEALSKYLNLNVVHSTIKIIFNKFPKIQEHINIFDLGVKREIKDKTLTIKIQSDRFEFLHFILLREAYLSFVPNELKVTNFIRIVINQLIENHLQTIESKKPWEKLIKENIVNFDFIESHYDRFEKFLKLQGVESFFFHYIRTNALSLPRENEKFYETIHREFFFKSINYSNNDDFIEALRIIIYIFYKVKVYRALLDYKNYFIEFKNSEEIETNLNLNQFIDCVQFINNSTYIAPSYHVNWRFINAHIVVFILRFSTGIKKKSLNSFFKNLPFLTTLKLSETNFSNSLAGFFLIPDVYFKDLINLFKKLKENGYIRQFLLSSRVEYINFLNLNYFKEFYTRGTILNLDHPKYNKNNEIYFNFKESELGPFKLDLLQFILIDRARFFSITGLSFERKEQDARRLKQDLNNYLLSQKYDLKRLRSVISIFSRNPELKHDFLTLLRNNKDGFFSLKIYFENLLNLIRIMKEFVSKRLFEKNTNFQIQEDFKKRIISGLIEENNILMDSDVISYIMNRLLPSYLQNSKEFEKTVLKLQMYLNFVKTCGSLKIFSINSIETLLNRENISENIYSVKENKLKKSLKQNKTKELTNDIIGQVLESLITNNPPILSPILINTIMTTIYAKNHIHLIIKDTQENREKLTNLERYFNRFFIIVGRDEYSEENILSVETFCPLLSKKEKEILVLICYNMFKEDLLSLERFFFNGFVPPLLIKDFYDFDEQKFFYTKDLYEQYYLYALKVFGKENSQEKYTDKYNSKLIWNTDRNISIEKLIFLVRRRVYSEKFETESDILRELQEFYKNMESIIINKNLFAQNKKATFFEKFVRSIKLEPCFQRFGLSQYYLYIKPCDWTRIDLKLLLLDTFQSIKVPACVGNEFLFIKYLFPYRAPNDAYLNYAAKTLKIVGEYCLFLVKKIYTVINFAFNLSSVGWNLDHNLFKIHLQKVLFEADFNFQMSGVKQMDFSDLYNFDFMSVNFTDIEDLAKCYGTKSLDAKSLTGIKYGSLYDLITEFIQKGLFYPYLKLKNMELIEEIYLIIPDVKKEFNDKLLKIFNFFNYAFIQEIEGEYFAKDGESVKFENGFFIKLYLPSCEMDQFEQVFDLLFEYLNIEKYLILSDLVSARNLLKNVFGGLEFLEHYNPLRNLSWNNEHRIFTNRKIFTQNKEPLYPSLTK